MADGELHPVEFQVQTPYDRTYLDARIAKNEARGLPEAVLVKSCIIVGSGPSAKDSALWHRLVEDLFYGKRELVTVAVNGALSIFRDHGMTPTYWACCDPQEEEVLRFVDGYRPTDTTYLLASKCPPALFDRLADRNVKIWRLDDMLQKPGTLHVPTAVSITLVTQSLMRFMGYHRFEMYGWDCCYIDGEHHASKQPEPTQPLDFSIEDEVTHEELHASKTTGAWMAELNDACKQTFNLGVMGYETVVHGPGAVGALLRAKRLIA